MPETQHLPTVIIVLAAAVIAVALFRKLHISPVLGYLTAGAVIGPGGAAIVADSSGTASIAELGLVFLLFAIGLELSWERLRTIRKQAFLLGILQVVVTAAFITVMLCIAGIDRKAATIIGSGLAMSSTALVMQLIAEHNQKASQIGRVALAVLLVQDLAVVPLLVLVSAFGDSQASVAAQLGIVAMKAACALLVILLGGQFVLRPLYRMVASIANPEIFTALTLFVVLGTGWLTYRAGLSLALGAFLAGLLMAETEYRHQVEADVLPFKGLLLGLFFIAIGMGADLHLAWKHLGFILSMAVALLAVKAAFTTLLARALGFSGTTAVQVGPLLAQGGEFAFILFRIAADNGFLETDTAQLLTAIVVASMVLTPLASYAGRWFASSVAYRRRRRAEDSISEMSDVRDHVIIIGFGRVGQMIAKLLSAENINYVALDLQIATVAKAKKIGLPVYYGDGSRREVLAAVGVDRAAAAIVTVNDPYHAENSVKNIRVASKQIPIIARALDLERVLKLEAAGANMAVSEMFEASLQLGGSLLKSIGIDDQEILRIMQLFRDRDYALAQGSVEIDMDNARTPYNKMLAFQNAVITGASIREE